MNLEEERIFLERCKSATEAISLILSMESEVKQSTNFFLWQQWTTRNKTNVGKKIMYSMNEICSFVVFHQMELGKARNHITSRSK